MTAIADLNRPPSKVPPKLGVSTAELAAEAYQRSPPAPYPIPQTAPGRPQDAPQAQAEPEQVADSPEPSAPSGEPHRRPRRTTEQITNDMIARIMVAETHGQIEDELNHSEYGRRSVPEKARIDDAAALRFRQIMLPQERPPEPAGEARSQEPAATPAPGREDVGAPDWPSDDTPGWVTEETATHTEPSGRYDMRDALGKVILAGQPPRRFLEDYRDLLANTPDPENVKRLEYHNKRTLQDLAQAEGGELGNDALDLLG